MKIALTSDVHLEFGDWYPVNPEGADVLVLSGDTMVASDLYGTHKTERFTSFLENCAKEYKHVVYVMGNHEHYNGDFRDSAELLREVCGPLGIHVLDNETVQIEDVTFIGGTLWTDMNKEDPLTLYQVKNYMNDFRVIRNSTKTVHFRDMDGKFHGRPAIFSPEDSVEEHKKMLELIRTTVDANPDGKFVVCGHHAPSYESIHEMYRGDSLMNGAYKSDLDEFIAERPQIKLWTHGHVHTPFDYTIGGTRVACNPRGYVGHERRSEKDEPYLPKVLYI